MTTARDDPDVDLLGDDGLLDLRPRARRTDAAADLALRELATPSPPNEVAPGMRASLGLCAVCGSKPARSTCRTCGRGACTTDTWAMLGLCTSCVNASGAGPGGGKA